MLACSTFIIPVINAPFPTKLSAVTVPFTVKSPSTKAFDSVVKVPFKKLFKNVEPLISEASTVEFTIVPLSTVTLVISALLKVLLVIEPLSIFEFIIVPLLIVVFVTEPLLIVVVDIPVSIEPSPTNFVAVTIPFTVISPSIKALESVVKVPFKILFKKVAPLIVPPSIFDEVTEPLIILPLLIKVL